MPTITSIESQKRRAGRRSVFVDGEFFAGVDVEVALKLGLKAGLEVTPADLQRVLDQEEEVRARERCLRWLDRAPRTRHELARRLAGAGVAEPVAVRVLDRLQDAGLVDDEALARRWLEQRQREGGWSRRRLTAALRQRGIPAETVELLLAELDGGGEREACEAAAEQAARKYRLLDRETARRRLAGYLGRRGFSPEDVFAAVKRVLP